MFKMFRSFVPVGLVVLTALICGCDGSRKPKACDPQLNADMCDSKNLDRLGLKVLWERNLPLFTGDRIYKMLTLGQNLYMISESKAMYCVTSDTGKPIWGLRITNNNEKVFDPILVENVKLSPIPMPPSKSNDSLENESLDIYDLIVINTPTRLYAIDNSTGKTLRDIKLGFVASECAACEGSIAELPGEQKTINEINILFGAPGKSTYTGIELEVPIMYAQGNFYLAGTNGKVFCYDSNSSYDRLWSFDVQGAVRTPYITNYRGLFIASGDRRIYGLDLASGKRLWHPVRVAGDFVGPMKADGDRLYQFVSGVGLVAIDMNDGKLAWKLSDGLMVLGSFKEKVYVLSRSRELIVVNASDGELIGKASLNKFERFVPNTTLRGIYAATANGKLVCICPRDVENITVEMLRSR